MASWVNW